ncbi:putative transcription factor B3-Domain family [Helianthus annuus]|nr:putative transcription factor B3-Domain family [Helianthus annuus]
MAMKNVDGEEWYMYSRVEISHGTERFYLTSGWRAFLQENDLCEGDECVFKFVRSEGTLLLAKVTKKEFLARKPKRGRPAKKPQPSGNVPMTEPVKKKRGRPAKQPQPSGEILVTEAAEAEKEKGAASKAAVVNR